ncbi:RNA polymerase [Pseudomonas phage Littlefix]|uniref:DNA-directed RNA polymerase n=1 Tax=Pseudomonas phage Littlefix TaxID=2079289 RepID=A0A2K9VI13_9CAUD|nr:RNA polymerase [Pseudomonas phage Littlefix]AUV61875.1 DNA-directed RNA polymerase [Pseudomonas phage Littlefix]
MKAYSAFEMICIDIANQGWDDKKLFEERIQWTLDNFRRLTVIDTPKKERPLYVKAVMALFDCCRGIAIGHMVGLDATCSGMSIMSVLTKCYNGCYATNLIDPNVRNDAYTMVTDHASENLGGGLIVTRQDAKDATMKGLYGSQAEPKKIFGEDTPELAAFYVGLTKTAPGAVELLGDLRHAWQAGALFHAWTLPDCYRAHVKVMVMQEARIEVDELDHSTFTHIFYVNEGTQGDLKLIANVTHSFDAYLLRCLVRRCNYNEERITKSDAILVAEAQARRAGKSYELVMEEAETIEDNLIERWFSSGVPDARLLDYLTKEGVKFMSDLHIKQMIRIANEMLSYPSFPVVTVHDEFKCHPNNSTQMRKHYVSILADLARGSALEDVYEQITGDVPTYAGGMDGDELAELILESNYAIS